MVDLLRMDVRCHADAAREVRTVLSQETNVPPLGDLRLVVSELVNNAVLHSGCSDEHTIEVSISLALTEVVVSVRDPGLSDDTARVLGPGIAAFGGMGLWLVAQAARRWGSESNGGYRVWAALPLES